VLLVHRNCKRWSAIGWRDPVSLHHESQRLGELRWLSPVRGIPHAPISSILLAAARLDLARRRQLPRTQLRHSRQEWRSARLLERRCRNFRHHNRQFERRLQEWPRFSRSQRIIEAILAGSPAWVPCVPPNLGTRRPRQGGKWLTSSRSRLAENVATFDVLFEG